MKTQLITQPKATPEQVEKHRVRGKNFMTPYIKGFYFIPHKKHKAEMLVELSEGDFMGSTMWGITCSNNGKSYSELSTALHSEKEVIEYINNLE